MKDLLAGIYANRCTAASSMAHFHGFPPTIPVPAENSHAAFKYPRKASLLFMPPVCHITATAAVIYSLCEAFFPVMCNRRQKKEDLYVCFFLRDSQWHFRV